MGQRGALHIVCGVPHGARPAWLRSGASACSAPGGQSRRGCWWVARSCARHHRSPIWWANNKGWARCNNVPSAAPAPPFGAFCGASQSEVPITSGPVQEHNRLACFQTHTARSAQGGSRLLPGVLPPPPSPSRRRSPAGCWWSGQGTSTGITEGFEKLTSHTAFGDPRQNQTACFQHPISHILCLGLRRS